jgi:hypothetical protein
LDIRCSHLRSLLLLVGIFVGPARLYFPLEKTIRPAHPPILYAFSPTPEYILIPGRSCNSYSTRTFPIEIYPFLQVIYYIGKDPRHSKSIWHSLQHKNPNNHFASLQFLCCATTTVRDVSLFLQVLGGEFEEVHHTENIHRILQAVIMVTRKVEKGRSPIADESHTCIYIYDTYIVRTRPMIMPPIPFS